MSVGSVVIVVLALALLAIAVLLVRSGTSIPWPAIVVASLTSAVCYTVGGSSADTSSPSTATVAASAAGLLGVLAAVLALVPWRSAGPGTPASRTPLLVAALGIALGAAGLLLTLLTG